MTYKGCKKRWKPGILEGSLKNLRKLKTVLLVKMKGKMGLKKWPLPLSNRRNFQREQFAISVIRWPVDPLHPVFHNEYSLQLLLQTTPAPVIWDRLLRHEAMMGQVFLYPFHPTLYDPVLVRRSVPAMPLMLFYLNQIYDTWTNTSHRNNNQKWNNTEWQEFLFGFFDSSLKSFYSRTYCLTVTLETKGVLSTVYSSRTPAKAANIH